MQVRFGTRYHNFPRELRNSFEVRALETFENGGGFEFERQFDDNAFAIYYQTKVLVGDDTAGRIELDLWQKVKKVETEEQLDPKLIARLDKFIEYMKCCLDHNWNPKNKVKPQGYDTYVKKDMWDKDFGEVAYTFPD